MLVRALIFSIIVLSNTARAKQFVNQLSSNWTLTNRNGSIVLNNLSVPISVHNALTDAKLTQNLLYGYNDVNLRWILYDDWTFTNYFQIDDNLNDNFVYLLEFLEIDTIASIYLNDKFIQFTNNQFIKYTTENLYSRLMNGQNKLVIELQSPVLYARNLSVLYPYRVPLECPLDVQKGECHINFLRKQQCSFSWDWGPAFGSIGINDAINFKTVRKIDFDFSVSLYPTTTKSSLDEWYLDLELDLIRSMVSSKIPVQIQIQIPELAFVVNNISIGESKIQYKLKLSKTNYDIKLWYPLNYGDQKLYNLTVTCTCAGYSQTMSKTIAFRSVELVQNPIGANLTGLTFYFKINNIPVFMKGSNWIPISVYRDRIDSSYLKWLLDSVAQANMNVLRVWGGGNYETDEFYNTADRLGIMIWQDFMFACATYPTNAEFLDSVKNEVIYQLYRLRHHPSIIIWAGNNENEAMISSNWYNTSQDKQLYSNDYRKLYVDTIRDTVLYTDKSRPYISSSPTNGKETESENWIATDPYDVRWGDSHFYDYSIDGWDPARYPLSRFTSEFGFQSFPSYSLLKSVYTSQADLTFPSQMNEHRQHHGDGNQQLVNQIQMHFNLFNLTNQSMFFDSVIYQTQINQAMSLKTAIEVFRRNRDFINMTNGVGMCMGVMYWQLNDIWQAPTWSSIEYGGKWKMAHYLVKNAFDPLLISPFFNRTDSTLNILIVSDYANRVISDSFELNIFQLNSLDAKMTKRIAFQIANQTSKLVFSEDSQTIEKLTGCEFNGDLSKNCLAEIKITSTGLRNFFFFKNKFNQSNKLYQVDIFGIERVSTNTFSIGLRSNANFLVLFVWLDISNVGITGVFSDNGFHMTTETRTVLFTTTAEVTVDDLKRYINIKSIVPFQ